MGFGPGERYLWHSLRSSYTKVSIPPCARLELRSKSDAVSICNSADSSWRHNRGESTILIDLQAVGITIKSMFGSLLALESFYIDTASYGSSR